jgi:hypothetical protein
MRSDGRRSAARGCGSPRALCLRASRARRWPPKRASEAGVARGGRAARGGHRLRREAPSAPGALESRHSHGLPLGASGGGGKGEVMASGRLGSPAFEGPVERVSVPHPAPPHAHPRSRTCSPTSRPHQARAGPSAACDGRAPARPARPPLFTFALGTGLREREPVALDVGDVREPWAPFAARCAARVQGLPPQPDPARGPAARGTATETRGGPSHQAGAGRGACATSDGRSASRATPPS